ncbi:hypothetical protein JL09_g6878 [Pichia kudriavzevii]|uniref:Uncharacterized protein n=1 Tax=Pichia kudriavzevii TaxID=4909 RepID=A0A099NKR6_PICKU|nr:hypothetical protein JL09_g6886 [Pichia kudriavzevii]KGK32515.1 hypothetical protein JL09_g6878 [Pichia kudriavzevii]
MQQVHGVKAIQVLTLLMMGSLTKIT